MSDSTRPILRMTDFALSFANGKGPRIQAVDGASLAIYPGQTVAVVGESGCGKSVTAMSMLGLVPSPPSRVDRGEMLFASEGGGVDLLKLSQRELRRIRGGEIAMIFQEPMTSLNPVYSIGEQLREAISLHRGASGAEARQIAIDALTQVGIRDPERGLAAYPHEYSGGMRQRAMIAMALACQPKLLIADEPTTALDVTVQKQILDLIRSLRDSHGMSVLLITHDLGVVAEQADVVCVMYAGRVVEYAATAELYRRPLHPYTRALLACIPSLDREQDPDERLVTVSGVTGDEAEWARLPEELGVPGSSVRGWWPWTNAPAGVRPGPECQLTEVSPGHWVGMWATDELHELKDRFPARPVDLSDSRPPRASTIDEGADALPASG